MQTHSTGNALRCCTKPYPLQTLMNISIKDGGTLQPVLWHSPVR